VKTFAEPRSAIGYSNSKEGLNTLNATYDDIQRAAKKIYKDTRILTGSL